MSAIRGTDRRTARSHNSSPYAGARPAAKKKSSWTFGLGGLLSYINPLRSRQSSSSDDGEDVDSSQDETQDVPAVVKSNGTYSPAETAMRSPNDLSSSSQQLFTHNPAASLSARGHQLAVNLNGSPQHASQNSNHNINMMFSTPPRVASGSPPDDANLSHAESVEKVNKFLREKQGQPLSEWETRGIATLLERTVQNDNERHEPFRFSSSPSRTPARGNSPLFSLGTPDASPTTASPNSNGQLPRRTLAKNPNGVYRWQGGGSARPRNRYQSPSFGTRSPAPTIKLSPVKTDTKRRRVGEEAESSSSQKVPFPAVSPQKTVTTPALGVVPGQAPAPSQARSSIFPSTNGASGSQPDGHATLKGSSGSAPRLRITNLPTKPTAPSVPSPLRQTWGQSDSPPHSPGSNTQAKPTPTKAASFMTDLIKEVTPPKRPDVSNPYQTASPVKPPTKKPTPKRPKAGTKPVVPPPVPIAPPKTPEPSPQAIIEATVPKGSKRSRPPPELFKHQGDATGSTPPSFLSLPAPLPPRRSPRAQISEIPTMNGSDISHVSKSSHVVVEEILDDDEEDHKTKKQKTGPLKEPAVTVEEIDDVDMLNSKPASPSLFGRPSEIIEPSDSSTGSGSKSPISTSPIKSAPSMRSTAPKEPSKLRFSYQAEKVEPSPAPASATSFTAPPAPKFSPAQLPASGSIKTIAVTDPKQFVGLMAVIELPTFTFPSPSASKSVNPAQEVVKGKPIASLPTYDFSNPIKASTSNSSGFNWGAAGIKPPTAPSGGSWKCDTCMCTNTADAKDKCAICGTESKLSAPVQPAAKGFDWAAAGVKAPSAKTGTWTCSVCALSNPETATKCTVCDATR